jgi:hypothetical protein
MQNREPDFKRASESGFGHRKIQFEFIFSTQKNIWFTCSIHNAHCIKEKHKKKLRRVFYMENNLSTQ